MSRNNVNNVTSDNLSELTQTNGIDPKHLSLEALAKLIVTDRMNKLESDSRKELQELKERQQKVAFLHKIIKAINMSTAPNGEFDGRNLTELHEMLSKAKALGVEIDENKLKTEKYNDDERERLVDNIRMTIEDLNIQNEMQFQLVTSFTNQRYEAYQSARNVLKPLHEDKMNKNRKMSER